MNNAQIVIDDLHAHMNTEKAQFLPKFFRALPGGYGEGDRFIGVTVPDQRKVAKKHWNHVSLGEVIELLHVPIHGYRLTALFIMVLKYQKAKSEIEKKDIVELYLENTQQINNWDLVDSSADKILGPYLIDKEKDIIYSFASSKDLWKQRIAIKVYGSSF